MFQQRFNADFGWFKGWLRGRANHSRQVCRGANVNLSALEDRILYSAVPFSLELLEQQEIGQQGSEFLDSIEEVVGQIDSIGAIESILNELAQIETALDLDSDLEIETSLEIVIVDATIVDHDMLVADILSQAAPNRHFEIRYLTSDGNGVQQISDILSVYSNVDALHLLTHGSDGELRLGGLSLNSNSMAENASWVADWGSRLSVDADVLIYGCNVAESQLGRDFVEQLSAVTGADIAASNNITGHASLGGDWHFEFNVGVLETHSVSFNSTESQWIGILPLAAAVSGDVSNSIDQETSAENRGSHQAVATDSSGNHVIVWSSKNQDGNGWGVYGQRFDSLGNEVGPSFLVNQHTNGDQKWASVDMAANGKFVVTWTDEDGNDSVYYRTYNALASPTSMATKLNSGTNEATNSSVSMNENGKFVVVWQGQGPGDSDGIYASAFTETGTSIVSKIRVNTSTSGEQHSPSVSMNNAGEFLVSWSDDNGIFARRFQSNGNQNGGQFELANNVPFFGADQYHSSVQLLNDGKFIASFTMEVGGFEAPGMILFNSNNSVLHNFGVTNQTITGQQHETDIVVMGNGNTVIVWSGPGALAGNEDANGGVYYRVFQPDGSALSGETRVNTYTTGQQQMPSVETMGVNEFVVVWSGQSATDSSGVYSSIINLGPANQAPLAHDNIYGLVNGGTINVPLTNGLLYNDSDSDSDPLTATLVTGPNSGLLNLNANGTFSYTHNGSTTFDSFVYSVSDGKGGSSNATVSLNINSIGFTTSNEFLVNQGTTSNPLAGIQDTHKGTGSFSESAISAADNGDYAIVWTARSTTNEENVFMRRYDASGTPLGDQVQVNDDLMSGDNHRASISMADDGRFVVVWSNEAGNTASQDGSAGSVYAQIFDANGTKNGGYFKVTENANSTGLQTNTDISMNASGDFAIVWEGSGPGDSQGIFLRSFDADGTPLGSTVRVNSVTAGNQYQPSVARANDGSVFVVWDSGNSVIGRAYDSLGNAGAEIITTNTFGIKHSSLAINDSGLVAMAFQVEVDDGAGGSRWDARLMIIDPANAVITSETAGNQTAIAGNHISTSVAFNDDGTILMTWNGAGSGDSNGVYARKFKVEINGGGNPYAEALGDEFRVNQTTSASQVGPSIASLGSENFVVIWSGNGPGDSNGIFARQFGNQSSYQISGNVLNDLNGDGSLADGVGVANATVKLYRDNGDGVIGANDQLIRTTATSLIGQYVFSGLQDGNKYWTVVDSKTIAPVGLNASFTNNDVWAEQTYGQSGTKFGGLNAGVSDNASQLITSQHVDSATINRSDVTGINFGFSFNVVTNLLGGGSQDDDAGINSRSVQGTLRQFITNANALSGSNSMRFVPMVGTNNSSAGGSWWGVAISTALPGITDQGTTLDGRAFQTDGVTYRNENTSILGTTGAVGVGADGIAGSGDEATLIGVDAPELEIFAGAVNLGRGFLVAASNVEISHFAVRGFGTSNADGGNILVDGSSGSVTNVTIRDNVLGSTAGAFAGPASGAQQSSNITVRQADNGLIQNNLIGFAGYSGIRLSGSNDQTNGADGWQILDNEIRDNARISTVQDGISIVNKSSDSVVMRNLIVNNGGYGIDTWKTVGRHSIANNTFVGNGHGGAERGAIRLFGTGSTVQNNSIHDNVGNGVHVIGANNSGSTLFASRQNLISKNSFYANSGISIDLGSDSNSRWQLDNGDGVSPNSIANDVNAGNAGLDYPELSRAYLAPDGLHVQGTINIALGIDRIEFYLAAPGVGDTVGSVNYGEGWIYLGTTATNGFLSFNSTTGEFEALLAIPGSGWPTELATGSVTAISIDDNLRSTSEFSGNRQVNTAPVANNDSYALQGGNTLNTIAAASGLLANDSDPNGDSISLNTTVVSGPLNGTLVIRANGSFDYTANVGFSGTDSFVYEIFDGILTDTATVNITLNGFPGFQSPTSFEVAENRKWVGFVSATDFESSPMNYSIVGGVDEQLFSINRNTGELRFKLAPDFETPTNNDGNNVYKVEVMADDGQGGATSQMIDVNVKNVNESPVGVGDQFNLAEGSSLSSLISVLQNDADPDAGDTQTARLVSGPQSGGLVFAANGTFNYQHDGGETTSDGFTYEVFDAGGKSSQAFVQLVISPVNDPTIVIADSLTAEGGKSLHFSPNQLLMNDIDPDNSMSQMEVVITTGTAHGTLSVDGNGQLVYTPFDGFAGVDTFEYGVKAGGVQGNSATVTIIVAAGNLPSDTSSDDPPNVDDDITGGGEIDPSNPPAGGQINSPTTSNNRNNDPNDQLADTISNEQEPIEIENGESEFLLVNSSITYASAENFEVADLTYQFVSIGISDRVAGLSTFDSSFLANVFWDEMDNAKREYVLNNLKIGVPSIVASAASFLTVGYLAWIIRGGVLLTTFMSSLPAWKTLDILPVLESSNLPEEDDESIEQMVDN